MKQKYHVGGNKDIMISDTLKEEFKESPSKTLLISPDEEKKKCLMREILAINKKELGTFEFDKTGDSFKTQKQDKKKIKYGNDDVDRIYGYQEQLKNRFDKKYKIRKIGKDQLKDILIKCEIPDYDMDCGKINYDKNKIDYSTNIIECVRKLPKPSPKPSIKSTPSPVKKNSNIDTKSIKSTPSPVKNNSTINTKLIKSTPSPAKKNSNNSNNRNNPFNKSVKNNSNRTKTIKNNRNNQTNVSYIISVKTSSEKKSSTDSNISIVLNGDKGSSSELKLKKSSTNRNKFEEGKTDIFTFSNIKNLGNVNSIEVSSDSARGITHLFSTDWKVEHIKIESSTGNTFTFNCNQWFSKKQGLKHTFKLDRKEKRNIRENSASIGNEKSILNQIKMNNISRKVNSNKLTYTVNVKTSNEKNSGTDSNISVEIIGTNGSNTFKLKNSKNNWNKFEKGALDEFEFKNQKDLGNINKIVVSKDKSKGLKFLHPEWKLEYVKINTSDGNTYNFQCNQKFNDEMGTTHEFSLSDKSHSKRNNVSTKRNNVSTKRNNVSNKRNNVSNKRNNVSTKRNNVSNKKNNVSNKKNNVSNKKNNVSNKKNSKKKNIAPLTKNSSNKTNLVNNKKNISKTSYTITVETSADKNSATDANITLKMHGNKQGETLKLSKSKTHRNKFEKGNIDKFEFEELEDLGQINKITVSSDGAKGFKLLHPEWKLSKITIEDSNGNKFYFYANKWFNKESGMSHEFISQNVEEVNKLNKLNKTKSIKKPTYKITIDTSKEQYSGTNNDITLLIHGSEGSSDVLELEESKTNKNKFEKGNTDVFEFYDMKDLGNIEKISVSWGGSGLKFGNPEWKLLKIEIENEKGEKFNFFANKWFGKREGKTHSFRVMSKEDVDEEVSKITNDLEIKPYIITTETSDAKNSGTDSKIRIVIHGKNDTTGALKLSKSKTNKNKFERGKTDIFEFSNIKNIGDIDKITVSTDNSRGLKLLHPEWKLLRVDIENEEGKKFHFYANKWFNKEDSTHDLYPEDKDEVDRKVGAN